jgi:Zn-dependent protease with chaperone function
MRNPNDYPSSTNVRFWAIAASVSMMVLWYGYTLPGSLRFINYYIDRPLSIATSLLLLAALWAAVAIYYFVHPFAAKYRGMPSATYRQLIVDTQVSAAEIGLAGVGVTIGDNLFSSDMVAYGVPFRRRIMMQRGALVYRARSPDKFKARLHHELGHIRNGDVDTGMISLALLYVSYVFIAGVIGFWTSQFLMQFDRLANDAVAFYTFAIYGVPLYISAIAWLGLLWMENRAFIRQREFMADAEAAFRMGPEAVISALGSSDASPHSPPRLWHRFKQLIHVHPTAEARIKSLRLWQRAGLPKLDTIVVVGAMWGLFISATNGVINQYPQQDRLMAWNPLPNPDGSEFVSIVFSDKAYLFILILTALLALLLASSTTSLAIRAGMQHRITGTSAVGFAARLSLMCVVLGFGIAIGVNFDPISLQDSFSSRDFTPSGFSYKFLFVVIIFAVTAIFSYSVANFITKGRRKKPIKGIEWFLFSLFFYAVLMQIAVSFITVIFAGDQLNWLGWLSFIGMLLLYGLGLVGTIYAIRNGFREKKEAVTPAVSDGALNA